MVHSTSAQNTTVGNSENFFNDQDFCSNTEVVKRSNSIRENCVLIIFFDYVKDDVSLQNYNKKMQTSIAKQQRTTDCMLINRMITT